MYKNSNWQFAVIAILSTTVACSGCWSPPPRPETKPETRPPPAAPLVAQSMFCPRPAASSLAPIGALDPVPPCNPGSCGANSPLVNLFPINGVRSNSDCNPDGVHLIPHSLSGARCRDATLELQGDALVGVDNYGKVVCSGDDMIGATFTVQSWKAADGAGAGTLRILIKEVMPYGFTNKQPAYRFEMADGPNHDSLCTPVASNAARTQLGTAVFEEPGEAPSLEKQFAIIVSSELYDRTGTPVKDGNGSLKTRDWLNFACVGDALAERSLHGLLTPNLSKSRAALRMFTANYCGDRPLTMRDTRIEWDPSLENIQEAIWNEQGAVCLNEPRVLYRESAHPTEVPAYLPPSLKKLCRSARGAPMDCPSLKAWITAAHQCPNRANPLPRCTGAPPADFTSYRVPPS